MHTSDMIYQAAKAHQTDLRRTAAGSTLKAYRHGTGTSRRRRFSFVRFARFQQARAHATAQQPQVRMHSASA